MRHMKKKLLLIMSICLMIFGLTACGEDVKSINYNGMRYEDIKKNAEDTILAMENLTEEQREEIFNGHDSAQINMLKRWDEIKKEAGECEGLGEFKLTKDSESVTCEQYVICKNRNVVVTYFYTFPDMNMTTVTIEEVYTMQEKMVKAGLNTLLGMGTTFVVLILISLIISCFRIFPYFEKKFAAKSEANAQKKQAKADKKAAKKAAKQSKVAVTAEVKKDSNIEDLSQTVEEAKTDDLELIAVISAAIAASTGTTTDGFVVRSVKRRF